MAQDVNINIKANSGDVNKTVKDLKNSIQETNQSASELGGTLQNTTNNISNQTGAFAGLKTSLMNVDSALGGVGKSMLALLANPVVLVITAIVGAFMALKKALTSTEEGQNKLAKVTKVISTIFQKLFDLLEPLASFLVDVVVAAFEAVGEAIDTVAKGVASVLEFFGFEDAADSLNQWVDDAAEAAENAAKVSDMLAEADKNERELIVERAKTNAAVAEAREKALDKENLTIEQRKKFLEEANSLATKLADDELKQAKLRFEAKKLENSLANSTKEDLEEQARLEAELFNAQAKRAELSRTLKREQDKLDKEAEAEAKAKAKEEEDAAKEKQAKFLEYRKNRQEAERKIEDLRIQNIEDDFERELESNRVKYERFIEDTKNNEKLNQEEKKKIIDYYTNLQSASELDIRKKNDEKLKAEQEKKDKEEADRLKAQIDLKNELSLSEQEKELNRLQEQFDKRMELAKGNEELELLIKDEFEQKKKDIEDKYRQQKEQAEKDLADKLKAQKEKEFNDTVEFGQKAVVAIGSLSDAIFSIKKRNLEKGSAEELKAAKQQFNVNKALQLSTATITGIKTVMDAYNNGMKNPIPLLGPATGIAYAITAGITSAANIAKIAASKFEGGAAGGGATIGSAPSTSGGAAATPPTFEPSQFFGLGQGTSTPGGGGQSPMKVYVTETDISKTQNKVQVIEDRAKIG